MDTIPFDHFAKVELRTARVLEVAPHPDAARLYLLQLEGGEVIPPSTDASTEGEEGTSDGDEAPVEAGPERRQIVAGVREHYAPEELVGRTIVVVWNLQPAVIRGQKSQGMLLAVGDGDTVSILGPDKPVAPGCRVT
ncbi:MAG: methionine--tRNA ligase subunit beta [Planctomycetota bacterium]